MKIYTMGYLNSTIDETGSGTGASEPPGPPGPQGPLYRKAKQVPRGHQVPKAQLGPMVPMAQQAPKDLQMRKDRLATTDRLAQKGIEEKKAIRMIRVKKEKR